MAKIKLGDEVLHKITKFKGIAVCRMTYLSGCDRIVIQPEVDKDGKVPDNFTFDEPEIEIVKKNNLKNKTKDIGGFKENSKHYLK